MKNISEFIIKNPKWDETGNLGKYEWMLVLNKLFDYQY